MMGGISAVTVAELRHLRLTLVPGFLQDWQELGIGYEALSVLFDPIEDHPHAVLFGGIAEDGAYAERLMSGFRSRPEGL